MVNVKEKINLDKLQEIENVTFFEGKKTTGLAFLIFIEILSA